MEPVDLSDAKDLNPTNQLQEKGGGALREEVDEVCRKLSEELGVQIYVEVQGGNVTETENIYREALRFFLSLRPEEKNILKSKEVHLIDGLNSIKELEKELGRGNTANNERSASKKEQEIISNAYSKLESTCDSLGVELDFHRYDLTDLRSKNIDANVFAEGLENIESVLVSSADKNKFKEKFSSIYLIYPDEPNSSNIHLKGSTLIIDVMVTKEEITQFFSHLFKAEEPKKEVELETKTEIIEGITVDTSLYDKNNVQDGDDIKEEIVGALMDMEGEEIDILKSIPNFKIVIKGDEVLFPIYDESLVILNVGAHNSGDDIKIALRNTIDLIKKKSTEASQSQTEQPAEIKEPEKQEEAISAVEDAIASALPETIGEEERVKTQQDKVSEKNMENAYEFALKNFSAKEFSLNEYFELLMGESPSAGPLSDEEKTEIRSTLDDLAINRGKLKKIGDDKYVVVAEDVKPPEEPPVSPPSLPQEPENKQEKSMLALGIENAQSFDELYGVLRTAKEIVGQSGNTYNAESVIANIELLRKFPNSPIVDAITPAHGLQKKVKELIEEAQKNIKEESLGGSNGGNEPPAPAAEAQPKSNETADKIVIEGRVYSVGEEIDFQPFGREKGKWEITAIDKDDIWMKKVGSDELYDQSRFSKEIFLEGMKRASGSEIQEEKITEAVDMNGEKISVGDYVQYQMGTGTLFNGEVLSFRKSEDGVEAEIDIGNGQVKWKWVDHIYLTKTQNIVPPPPATELIPTSVSTSEKISNLKESEEWKKLEQARLKKIKEELAGLKSKISITPDMVKQKAYEEQRKVVEEKIIGSIKNNPENAGLSAEQLQSKINDTLFEHLVIGEYQEYENVKEENREKTWKDKLKIEAAKALNNKAVQWYMRQNKYIRFGALTLIAGSVGVMSGGLVVGGVIAGNRLRRGALSFGAAGTVNKLAQKRWSIDEVNEKEKQDVERIKNSKKSLQEQSVEYAKIAQGADKERKRRLRNKTIATVAAGAGVGAGAGIWEYLHTGLPTSALEHAIPKSPGVPKAEQLHALTEKIYAENPPIPKEFVPPEPFSPSLPGGRMVTEEPPNINVAHDIQEIQHIVPQDSPMTGSTGTTPHELGTSAIPKETEVLDATMHPSGTLTGSESPEPVVEPLPADTYHIAPDSGMSDREFLANNPPIITEVPPEIHVGQNLEDIHSPKIADMRVPEAPTEIAIPKEIFPDPSVVVRKTAAGDSIWNMLRKTLDNNDRFKNLSGTGTPQEIADQIEAKQTRALQRFADEVAKNYGKYGAGPDGKILNETINKEINFADLFKDSKKFDEVMRDAESLKPTQVRSIIMNNRRIEELINSGKPVNVDEILKIKPKVGVAEHLAINENMPKVEPVPSTIPDKLEVPQFDKLPNEDIGIQSPSPEGFQNAAIAGGMGTGLAAMNKIKRDKQEQAKQELDEAKKRLSYLEGMNPPKPNSNVVSIESGKGFLRTMESDRRKAEEMKSESTLSPQQIFEDGINNIYGKRKWWGPKVRGIDTPEWKEVGKYPAGDFLAYADRNNEGGRDKLSPKFLKVMEKPKNQRFLEEMKHLMEKADAVFPLKNEDEKVGEFMYRLVEFVNERKLKKSESPSNVVQFRNAA